MFSGVVLCFSRHFYKNSYWRSIITFNLIIFSKVIWFFTVDKKSKNINKFIWDLMLLQESVHTLFHIFYFHISSLTNYKLPFRFFVKILKSYKHNFHEEPLICCFLHFVCLEIVNCVPLTFSGISVWFFLHFNGFILLYFSLC